MTGTSLTNFAGVLRLSGQEPLGVGVTRLAFVHPDDPTLLVKVMRPDKTARRWGTELAWYKRWRRYRHLIVFLREIREQLALHAQSGSHSRYLQRIVGFAETDLGLGLVVEAALDRDGNIGPTLRQQIETGTFDQEAKVALSEFFAWLLDAPIVATDIKPGNLLYAFTPGHGSHYVLVDGYGDTTLIPINAISSAVRRSTKRDRIARLQRDWPIIGSGQF